MAREPFTDDDTSVNRYAESGSALRGLPGDLIVVGIYTIVVGVLIGLLGGVPTTVRFAIGIPFLLFVPGYAVLSTLFPGRPSRNAGQVSSLSGMSRRFGSMRSIQQRGVRWGERVALSFGLSMFIIPILALTLDLVALVLGTGSLYRTGPIVVLLATFSLLFTLIGALRRLQLPRAQRYGVPVGYWLGDFADGITGSPVDALINVLLVLSVLVGAASLTYGLAVPQDAETSTNLYVGMQTGSGGFVERPPQNFTVNQPQQLVVGIDNHEQRPMNYTVVVDLERRSGSDILARDELKRFSTPTVPANATWRNQHTVTPTISENNLQLVYLLYEGDAPANATEATANESVHVAINVSGGGS